MLGRKSYTREEYNHAKKSIEEQLAAYKALVKVVGSKATDKRTESTLSSFEVTFFNNMVLVLDRPFVHRLRSVTGKDGDALNEVELLCDALILHKGVFEEKSPIEYIPEQSVLKLETGDSVRLTESGFERLASAFFVDLKGKYV
jgi:hypothetical protein